MLPAKPASPPGDQMDPALGSRVEQLRSYLAADPDNLALLADLADILLQNGRGLEATPCIEHAMSLAAGDGPWRYRRAVAQHQQGQLTDARATLEGLLASGSDAPAIRMELGRVAFAQSDWGTAAEHLEHASKAPGLPVPLIAQLSLMLMRALHRQGSLDHAIAVGESFIAEHGPATMQLQSALATLYLDAERLTDAARLYEQCQAQAVNDAEMLAVGGFLAIQDARTDEAQRRFERSLAVSSHMGRAYLGLGLVYASTGQLQKARDALGEATVQMPDHLGTWHALAWMHLLERDFEAAGKLFEHALTLDRNFGDTYGGLAIVALLQGQRERANELLLTGQRLDRLSLNVGVARTLLRQGGHFDSPGFLDEALKMLYAQALSRNEAQKTLFEQLLARSQNDGLKQRH